MNKNRLRITTLKVAGVALGSAVILSSSISTRAAGISNTLPSAGFSLTVEGGTSVSTTQEEVKQIVNKNTAPTATKGVSDVVATNQVTVKDTIHFDKEVVEPVVVQTIEEEETVENKEDFSNLVIADVNDYVNVRDCPDENEGKIVGKLYDNSVGTFIEETNGWYLIESGNCKGYVKAEYCVTGEAANALAKEVGTRMARVNTVTLKVREEPGLDATVLGLVPIDDELLVVEELDGWVKVDIEEGYGFVSLDYVELHTEFVKAESKEEEEARLAKEKAERDKANAAARQARAASEKSNAASGTANPAPNYSVSGNGIGAAVANYGLQFVGNPYVYGGSSLTHGTDCSGFVMSVYSKFGVALPHSSAADRSVGYDVGGLANAQPGDIVCYSGHVGIYIGNGQIVHASTSRTGIIVSNATYRTPLCVRRIF